MEQVESTRCVNGAGDLVQCSRAFMNSVVRKRARREIHFLTSLTDAHRTSWRVVIIVDRQVNDISRSGHYPKDIARRNRLKAASGSAGWKQRLGGFLAEGT